MVKNLLAMQEMQEIQVQSLGQEDPLDNRMATHSSIPAWRVSWTGSLVSYSPRGCKRVTQNLETKQQLGVLKGPIISQLREEQLAPGFLK